ncbi:unnamed protein product [Ilex paraguariensis]|uniref:Cell wall protein n=1 Tax=Ilex paraguariensis TaxID=185542 RepID=A0ABC8SKH2_9AQUA
MAYKSGSILAFLFILNVLLSLSGHAHAGRDIPMNDSKNTDKKQPESFFDGSVLIPGFGRVMVPTEGSPFNPFTYNPVTGTNGGAAFHPVAGPAAAVKFPVVTTPLSQIPGSTSRSRSRGVVAVFLHHLVLEVLGVVSSVSNK